MQAVTGTLEPKRPGRRAPVATAKPAPKREPEDGGVTDYARQVVAGKIVAGPDVRAACARHLRDLADGPARGLRWDKAAAKRAIGFYGDVLCLNSGEYEGQPFALHPWQRFVVGSLFGWKGADGWRRFRLAYIETAKGNGKSPLVAGMGMYGLVADGEPRAEIYFCAAKRDQAMIMYRDATAMVENSPVLSRAVSQSRGMGVENLAYARTGSFFRPIAADDRLSGSRPHMALLDEIHEHRDANAVNMMRLGTKARRQALIVMITNSGHDRQSVAWHYHEYAQKVAAGTLVDDGFFGYVCGLDKDDDPFADETCWPKANPSLVYGLPGYPYIRREVTQARGMPSAEAEVRRLCFCQWTEALAPWIGYDQWEAAREDIDLAALAGRPVYAGLDLSETRDLTSLVLSFPPLQEGEPWRVVPYFWLPKEGLLAKEQRERVPYYEWAKRGVIETTEGPVIDRRAIMLRLVDIARSFDLRALAYDRYDIRSLQTLCEDEGLSFPWVEFGQGFVSMAPAVREFERLLIGGQLRHNGNPCLRFCAASTVLDSDPAGNRKPNKAKSTGRIDGIVASLMAVGTGMQKFEGVQATPQIWVL